MLKKSAQYLKIRPTNYIQDILAALLEHQSQICEVSPRGKNILKGVICSIIIIVPGADLSLNFFHKAKYFASIGGWPQTKGKSLRI